MLMKEYIPALPLHNYIHRYWIMSSREAMAAENCLMDGFVKLFIYLNDNLPVYCDKRTAAGSACKTMAKNG